MINLRGGSYLRRGALGGARVVVICSVVGATIVARVRASVVEEVVVEAEQSEYESFPGLFNLAKLGGQVSENLAS